MNRISILHRSVLILCVTFALLLAGCGQAGTANGDSPRTIILAHGMHLAHPVSVAMERMAELVEENSAGQLRIKIYPAGQLGNERELLELIQIGTVGMTKVSGATLENIVPEIRVFSLPYLFRDDDHYRKVTEGEIGQELLEVGTPYRLKGLAYYDAGWRSFYTVNRPIERPEDVVGVKIRVVPSVMATRFIREWGGSPTPISYGELYTAFQGGIVDAAENNPPSFYTSRHYEVTNYYILNEHTAIPDFLVIGSRVWEGLSEEEQRWLQDAVDESVQIQRVLWEESVEESMRVVQEAGVEVIYPDKEPFIRSVEPIYERFQREDPELYEWIERIRQVE